MFNPNVDKTEAKRQRLEKLFKKTDTDGSGFLEADELRQLFKETFQKDDLNFDEGFKKKKNKQREKIKKQRKKGNRVLILCFNFFFK